MNGFGRPAEIIHDCSHVEGLFNISESSMAADEELRGSAAEIAQELHRAMRYMNDLIRDAAHAGLTVDVRPLKMYGTGRIMPQISLAVRHDEIGVIAAQ